MSSTAIQQQIVAAAPSYGVSPAMALAVAQAESNFNPNAVSPVGAQGIFQLMPATAAGLGVTNAFDPTQNINGGLSYLSQLMSEFSSPEEALAAYNWGPGNVQSAVATYGDSWFDHIPTVTQNYVSGILGSAPASTVSVPSGLTSLDSANPFSDGDDSDLSLFGVDLGDSSDLLLYGGIAAAGILALTIFSGK